jgi:hypothetical protein
MFNLRNLGGVALVLMGTSRLWLTPESAGREVSTSGVFWSVLRAPSLERWVDHHVMGG